MVSDSYRDSLTLRGVLRFVIGLASVALVLYLFWYFSEVVIYIMVSAVLAIMFRPLVSIISDCNFRGHAIGRGVGALLTLFVIWGVFGVLFSVLLPLVFSKLHQLTNIDLGAVVSSIESPVLNAQHYIQNLLSLPESDIDLSESLVNWGREVIDLSDINAAFSSVVGVVVSAVISFFSISFITYFFLKDENLFLSMVTSIFPSRYSSNVERALNSITTLLSRYFAGLMAESFLIGSAVSIAMICWGMQASDALFMGCVMGLLNVIPYAGPTLGICFSLFLGIISPIESLGIGNTVAAIAASLMIIKGLDDFLLQPTLYSERVKAHPLEVFIVILMSGYVAGVVGMLLAIPSYTVLRVFAKEFFSQYTLVQKLTREL